MNDVANHPANIKAFDFDKTVQIAKTYLDGEALLGAQAESQLERSQWSDEDWKTLQALGLCGALPLLRGRVKSGLLLLIAVALVSKKRPRVGSQEQSKAESKQEEGGMDGTRATGQQDFKRLQKDPKEKNGATPKKAEEAQPPKRDKDQGHPIECSKSGG